MSSYLKLVDGIEVEMTPEEVAQRQTEENTVPTLPLAEQLNQVFSELPIEQQADLSPLKAAVKLELDLGNTMLAQLIITRAIIPSGLETIRQAMLALFPDNEM